MKVSPARTPLPSFFLSFVPSHLPYCLVDSSENADVPYLQGLNYNVLLCVLCVPSKPNHLSRSHPSSSR